MAKIFEVQMVCKVRKLVTVECETEDQAKNDPWEYAIDEQEMDQIDFEVVDVSEVG
jgi:hypothetical protein